MGDNIKGLIPDIEKAMRDESHEIRAMAAWTLIRLGDREAGTKGFEVLLKENAYAMLTVLNMIDWLGKDGQKLLPAVRALKKIDRYSERMRKLLF